MASVQFTYSDKRIEALKIFLQDNGTDIDREMKSAMDSIWEKFVPEAVRTYIDRTDTAKKKEQPAVKRSAAAGAVGPRKGASSAPPDVVPEDGRKSE